MNKHIRLLFENMTDNIFNDPLFNQDDTYNIIGEQIFSYTLCEVLYDKKIPYAICCGEDKNFNDNKFRFLYLYNNENIKAVYWCRPFNQFKDLKEPCFHKFDELIDDMEDKLCEEELPYPNEDDYDETDKNNKIYFGYKLNNFKDFMHIDEQGFQITQIIKNNYDLNNFPVFKNCCELGDDIYLPAIDELQIMFLNIERKELLRKKINEIKKEYHINYNIKRREYWSSSVLFAGSPYFITLDYWFDTLNNNFCKPSVLTYATNNRWPNTASFLPFIKI